MLDWTIGQLKLSSLPDGLMLCSKTESLVKGMEMLQRRVIPKKVKSTSILINILLFSLLLCPCSIGASDWRELNLSPKRQLDLANELESALKKRWRKRFLDIEVKLQEARVMSNGKDYHLLADGGTIDVREGTIGDLPISGAIELGFFAVDYAPLGIGKVKPVKPSFIKPSVNISMKHVKLLLEKSGFKNSRVRWDGQNNRLHLTAEKQLRFLFFRFSPRFYVSGRIKQEKEYILRLDRVRMRVKGILGFFANIALSQMERKVAQTIDLRKDYRKLARKNIYICGGDIMVLDKADCVLKLSFPPHPRLKRRSKTD